jgi:hypothetical protein
MAFFILCLETNLKNSTKTVQNMVEEKYNFYFLFFKTI